MNCESLRTLLDHSDLNAISDSERHAVHLHVESCPDCAAVLAVHDEFLALRIPSVPADLEKRCLESIEAAPDGRADRKRASRRRAGFFVLGSVVVAAAAAIVGPIWLAADDEGRVAEDATRSESTSVQRTAGPDTASLDPDPDSFTTDESTTATAVASESTRSEPFTVELTRLVPAGQTQMSRLFGDWFHAALVEELGRVPNLVLVEAAGDIEVSSIPSDPDPSAAEFSFDRDTTTWRDNFDFRLAAGAGVGDDWVGHRWAVVSAEGNPVLSTADSNAMRRSAEARPEYAAALAEEIVEHLRINRFPADAAMLASRFARHEAVLTDVSAEVTERSRALFAAEEIARRANDPIMTARLVDATLTYAGQIEDALLNSSTFVRFAARATASEMEAARAQFAEAPAGILNSLSGLDDARVIGPMSEALLYDQNDETRRAAVSVLGEFVEDAVARAALEYAAEFDASAEVREAAQNFLLDDDVHVEGILSVVRDSSLSDEERLIAFMVDPRLPFVEKGFSVDVETVDIVSDLIDRNDAGWRREALYGLSWTKSPSFVPVYLERLRTDPSPEVRADLLGILSEYRSLPEVEIALEEAAAEDPADNIRAEAARILNDVSP